MEADYWHQKWERGDIRFHENEANQFLVQHFNKLNLVKGCRVFLPLCGKTRSFAWLLAQGYRVVGSELSEFAINDLFKELGVKPEISKVGALLHYHTEAIDIFVGDFFDVNIRDIGPVNAIYDRAALVALPPSIREQYTLHLINITKAAPQLLITYEYNQELMDGPPFSVNENEVKQHYGATYQLKAVERKSIADGFKGKIASIETAWLLQNRIRFRR